MKRKMNIALCGASILVFALAGCGQQSSQSGYIGIDAAKAIALEAAGISASDADFSSADLKERDGTDYYDVDFTAGEMKFEYDIDAMTGVIISEESESNDTAADTRTAEDGNSTSDTSSVTEASSASQQSDNESSLITADEARGIALEHAGLDEGQVTFLKSKLERDDGQQVYDIEFYTDSRQEYDYEIDASTGEILSYDYDIENYTYASGESTAITADEAREIALSQVPGATSGNIYEFETDYDDGRLEYEGTILYNGMEYEFTIDGYSGTIREWDVERSH